MFAEVRSAACKRALLASKAVERGAGFRIAAARRIRTIAVLRTPASAATAASAIAVRIALALTIAVLSGGLGILAIARARNSRLAARRLVA